MDIIKVDYTPFKGRIAHDRIEQFHIDALDFVIQMYSPTQKLALLGLTLDQLKQAVKDYEAHFSNQLIELLNAKLIDESYGLTLNLMEALIYLDLPYKSTITFKRLLANGKVPHEHIIMLLEMLEKEYRHK